MEKTSGNTLKDKKQFVREKCAKYKMNHHSEIMKNASNRDKKNLMIFDHFFRTLNDVEQYIFLYDFWDIDNEKEWFLKYCSKSTYYRRVKIVVDRFIKFFCND
ncbi:hypothetical protein [[Mycoplasma] gypis]|uniref:Transcriptional regulator n=1 Tax=[Mycoplasma] gypis TaxID=92404 RepID=A0ABZ2RNN9_9BACT|nr:hypothetical protein [[Mycoplasma] gypis]MBN0919316.1 hypothetical protein [[Mycoplasma] gypis]